MTTYPALVNNDWAFSSPSGGFQNSNTYVEIYRHNDLNFAAVTGFRFYLPPTFDPSWVISAANLVLTSNSAVASTTYRAKILIGNTPAWANTTNVETGSPWHRRSSTLNTGSNTDVTQAVTNGGTLTFGLSGSDIIAAINANALHATSGTYLGVLIMMQPMTPGVVGVRFASGQAANAVGIRPTLNITYTAPYTMFKSGNSVSSGSISLKPRTLRGRWHGDTPEILAKEAMVPKTTAGSGDLPPTDLSPDCVNPNGTAWALWVGGAAPPTTSRIRISSDWTGSVKAPGQRPKGSASIFCEGFLGKQGLVYWDLPHYVGLPSGTTTKTSSGTLAIRHDGLPASGDPPQIAVYFRKAGTNVFGIEFRSWTFDGLARQVRMFNAVDGTFTAWSTTTYTALGNYHRFEWQISQEATGAQLQARMYVGESTTPAETFSLACTNTDHDQVVSGTAGVSIFPLVSAYITDVEIWDDYYCGGKWLDDTKKGQLYTFGEWEYYYKDSGGIEKVDYYGKVTSVSPLTFDTTALDGLMDFEGERWARTGPTSSDPLCYTKYTDVNYSNQSSVLHKADVYVPNMTPPPGGFKVIYYLHGGFFVSGSKNDIPLGLVIFLCLMGYVVISLDIILSSTTPVVNNTIGSGSQAYPAWDKNSPTARHPTQILDYKLAITFFQHATRRATYNLSTDCVVMGHSAGAMPALLALYTKDITNDGNGMSYRLKDHTSDYGYPNVDDPEIKGAYVLSPPTDFERLINYEPTMPRFPYVNTGVGIFKTTRQLYFGKNLGTEPSTGEVDGSKVANMIALQSDPKPMVYFGGDSDYLVPCMTRFPSYDQAQPLKDAFIAKGMSSRCEIIRAPQVQHYQTPFRVDVESVLAFIQSVMPYN